MGSERIPVQDSRVQSCTRSVDRLIGELADAQHGVVGRWQLLDRGVRRGEIGHRLATGRLRSIHRGVYAVGHVALTRRSRWMAGVLAVGPDRAGAFEAGPAAARESCGVGAALRPAGILSHWSAGELRGYVELGSGPVHLSATRRLESRHGLHFHLANISADEIDHPHGIPTTGPFRTVLDLAPDCGPGTVDSALAKIEADEITDNLSFAALLDRYPARRGTRRLRQALARNAEVSGFTRSQLERGFLDFLRARDLPLPETNVRMWIGARRVELDCLWRDYWLAAELDSWTHHKDRRSFHADRARNRSVIARAGLRMINITDTDLKGGRDALEDDMRHLLSHPAPEPFSSPLVG